MKMKAEDPHSQPSANRTDCSTQDAPLGPTSDSMYDRYESGLGPGRRRILDLAQSTILNPCLDASVLHLFLIHFSAQGVYMTEPVESWVDRAGQRCEQIGLPELGRFLRMHAREEANHHLWFIEDLRRLVPMWNVHAKESLDIEELLRRPPASGARRYRQLFEDVITGDAPFAELAIESEIENLSLILGRPFLEQCQNILGPEIIRSLSFIRQHVCLDADHTKFNAEQLGRLLQAHPEYVPSMVDAGEEALGAYGAFVNDCFRLACTGSGVHV
jgi:hypothetical protein